MSSESANHEAEHGIPSDLKRPGAVSIIGALLLLIAAIAAMFFIGYSPREKQAAETKEDAAARAAAIPRLAVTRPRETAGNSEVTLNCDVKANKATTILARTSGYLKKLHAEINDLVKEGQLLAEIDSPEIDAELLRSRASLNQVRASEAKAETTLALAERSLKRDQSLPPGARTVEDLDTRTAARDSAVDALTMAKADVEYAQAEVKRLTVLQSFERVTAPYAGRITFRYLDVGALISPGTNSNAELFTLAETDTARIIIHAPQSYATDIDLAGKPILTVRNYPGREYTGVIGGNAGQFDPATRTMLFLLLFPNPDGTLYPGMYGQVKLALLSRTPVLQIPTSSILSSAEGTRVMVVQDGVVHLRSATFGRDFGTEIEVLTGLTKDDLVVVNPQLQITDGTKVKILPRAEEKVSEASKVGAK